MDAGIRKLFFWMKLITECVVVCVFCLILDLVKKIVYFVNPKKKDINGETVLVTGAAGSIGRGLALQLSRFGCSVICVDSDAEGNMRTAKDIVKQGHTAQAYTCDITDNTAVEELAKKVGYVDILVNSAGIIYFDSILKTQQATVSKVLDINVASHFVMIRNFLPGMLERNKGHIVGIASCSGLMGLPNATVYSCSKFAVVGLMESLTEELRFQGRSNIKTSCVCHYLVKINELLENKINSRIPVMEPEDMNREIVEGILQERRLFAIPSYVGTLMTIGKLLPDNVCAKLKDRVMYCRIEPQVT